MKKIISSQVSQPNNEYTDNLPTISHDVTIEDEKGKFVIQLMAVDPIDAIEKAHEMDIETCYKLKKKM